MRTFLIVLAFFAIVSTGAFFGLSWLDAQERLYWTGYVRQYHCARTGETRLWTAMIPVLDSKGRERAFVPNPVHQELWKCDNDRWVWL